MNDSPGQADPATALTLAIETSNPSAATDELGPGVALGRGAKIIDQERLRRDSRHDDELMPAVARLCERAGVEPRQLDRVAVSVGPGGLTGLRIAVVAAASMCESLGIDCVPVPTSRVAREHVKTNEPFGIVLASKQDRGWLVVYEPEAERVIGDCDVSALDDLAIRALYADPALPEVWKARASDLGIRIQPLGLSAQACLRASIGVAPVDPGSLRVLYPREPDAVTAWRRLHDLPDA